jgi:hypothetical protein
MRTKRSSISTHSCVQCIHCLALDYCCDCRKGNLYEPIKIEVLKEDGRVKRSVRTFIKKVEKAHRAAGKSKLHFD